MNRHAIIRLIVAVIWIVVGIIMLARKDVTMGAVGILLGVAFGISGFMMLKKK